MTTHTTPYSILLLAGGRGQRMGGQDKGLMDWHGLPLIAHIHALVRPLTDDLIISCNRNQERYATYADQLVCDTETDFPGPLAGILAGLAQACHPQMLVLPCDAPSITAALLHALLMTAQATPQQPLMVRQGEQWQPLFSVLPRSLYPDLLSVWEDGERSPMHALLQLGAQPYHCAPDDPRISNLNTLELLQGTARPGSD